jgi:4-methyl-5(b-hydroxyethyl)-thiazole monophosphate biosynthesis
MSAFSASNAPCTTHSLHARVSPVSKARQGKTSLPSSRNVLLTFPRPGSNRASRFGAIVGHASGTETPPPVKKVLVPIADGTEEIEAVTVIDVLRRAGAEVTVMSVEDGRNEVVCSRGVRLVADANVKDVAGRGAPNDWDLIAVPGGMPGAEHIADHTKFHAVLEKHFRAGKLMAGICAAPAICFEPKGFLEVRIWPFPNPLHTVCPYNTDIFFRFFYVKGFAATAHPAFVDELGGSLMEKNDQAQCRVVVDKTMVTSRGPGTSLEWSLCLVEQLFGKDKAKEVAGPMVVQPANAKLLRNLEWRLDETPVAK